MKGIQNYTKAYQEHKVCGYGYKIVCQYDDKYSKPYKGYRGEHAIYKLIATLLEEQKEIKQNFSKEMIISKKNKMILKMLNRTIYATSSTTMKMSQCETIVM